MICVLSWNIQNGKGVDGVVDLARIAALIREMGDPDVVCLQEVSRGLALEGAGTPDQVAELGALFPEHEVIFGAAVDNDPGGKGARWQFGNMLLSRLPVLSRQQHLLPRPAVADARHMVRQAIDVILACADRRLRVVTTHLEFHSALQRRSQVQRLRDIEKDAWALNRSPPAPAGGPYDNLVPPAGALLCGDFNMEVGPAHVFRLCRRRADHHGCLDKPLSGPAARADLRHLRSGAVAARSPLPRFLLRRRAPCRSDSKPGRESGKRRIGPPAPLPRPRRRTALTPARQLEAGGGPAPGTKAEETCGRTGGEGRSRHGLPPPQGLCQAKVSAKRLSDQSNMVSKFSRFQSAASPREPGTRRMSPLAGS